MTISYHTTVEISITVIAEVTPPEKLYPGKELPITPPDTGYVDIISVSTYGVEIPIRSYHDILPALQQEAKRIYAANH